MRNDWEIFLPLYLLVIPFSVALLIIFSITGCGAEETDLAVMRFDDFGGGCGLNFDTPVPQNQFIPGSYADRNFLSPLNHLGQDIALLQETPVNSIGAGKIVWYGPASGYGELVAVIEHDLFDNRLFNNGNKQSVSTSFFISIYGHLRKSAKRGGVPLPFKIGDYVEAGETIGYVNDNAHNGDGAEHLHLGARLMSAKEAQSRDRLAWFRGYDSANGAYRGDYAAADETIKRLQNIYSSCNLPDSSDDDPPDNPVKNTLLALRWSTPNNQPASRIALSGKISDEDWKNWQEVFNASFISADIKIDACQNFDFSVEYLQNNSLAWSCFGSGAKVGNIQALWNNSPLAVSTVSNGLGGCNLRVSTPCNGEKPQPVREEPANGGDNNPNPQLTGSSNTITCSTGGGKLIVTALGAISSALVGGPLPSPSFVSLGSNETGWNTSSSLPRYYAIYNGDVFAHQITVPDTVRRFNLWAGAAIGNRWFDLRQWKASGANCDIISDGNGGLIVSR